MKGRKRLVVHVEDLQAIALAHVPHADGLHHVYLEPFLNEVVELEHGGQLVAHLKHALGPVDVLREAKLLEHGAVIRVVVEASEGAQVLVTFHQQAFLVHVGESPRASHLGATPCKAPVGHRVNQGLEHLFVFDEVEPPEAHEMLLVVGLVVDDGCHAPHDLLAAIGQETVGLAEVVGTVLLWVEGVILVAFKGWHPVGAVLVKAEGKRHKHFQLLVVFNFDNVHSHRSTCCVSTDVFNHLSHCVELGVAFELEAELVLDGEAQQQDGQ